MIESCVLGPKTGPERQAGYQTNFPPTAVSHRGWSMASSTECKEGAGSTYVLAPQLLLPCWSWSQTSPQRENGWSRENRDEGINLVNIQSEEKYIQAGYIRK